MGSNEGIGVSRVSYDAYLDGLFGDSVECSSLSLEDFSISLEEVGAFHSGSTGSGTDHDNNVGVFESDKRVSSGDN